ncbi:MAG: methylmalonyl Co-A mutase-associated GTPase MeaB [Chloroflexi bacterium]|nr:methylmalonyl Co-A mutase-associated GTPase MeaB [Chloroflexota bacterium]
MNGDRLAIARLISLMERGGGQAQEALAALYRHTGRAQVIGVTGAPGTGKSTLVNEVAKAYRQQGLKVGVVAVDPTSPFSGGAILGDRIRMRDVATDPYIFIRSMATRGNLGGLARATADATHVLDAAGYPVILVETVGAGQNEVDIARMAHTTVVLQMPASGDDIQAIKAGILEIADILVVNKADLPGADNTVAALRAMLDLNSGRDEWHHGQLCHVEASGREPVSLGECWRVPVLKTCALRGEGVAELVAAIQAHWQYQNASGWRERREHDRIADELQRVLRYTLLEHLLSQISGDDLERTVQHIVAREQDPYSAAETLIRQAGLVSGKG